MREMERRTLQDVDVVKLQVLQAVLDRVKDVFPAQTVLVDIAKVVGIFGRLPDPFRRQTGNNTVEL